MSISQNVEVQSQLLTEAYKKYDEAKKQAVSLKVRVGPTSQKLYNVRMERNRARREVARLVGVLKKLGLSEVEIGNIKTREIDSLAA